MTFVRFLVGLSVLAGYVVWLLRRRQRPTKRDLVASMTFVALLALSEGKLPNLETFFNGYALGAHGIVVGSCFVVIAIPLAMAWLCLVTFARRWPDDGRVVVPPHG